MCVGTATRGDTDPSRWVVDQRAFVWAEPSKPADVGAPGSPRLTTTWTDCSLLVAPLPRAPYSSGGSRSLATTGGEAGPSETLGCSTPVQREGKVLQSKVWEAERNGGQGTALSARSVFLSPPSLPGSSVDTLQTHPRIPCIPVVQELTEVPYPAEVWKRARCKDGGYKRSLSWAEDLIEEDRVQNAATLQRQLSSSSTYSAKTSTLMHHNSSHSSRHGASSKGEPATPFKDVPFSESLSDSHDEEGVQVVSEKRRKRMLSNRASAQRSRQRRQDRLDTLEVLVAELRVENTTLVRKVKNADATAKKFEEENKILRNRVGKQETLPLSDGNKCDPSDKKEISGAHPRRSGSPSNTQEVRHDSFPRESLGSLMNALADEPLEDSKQDPHQSWNISRSSFGVDFTYDPMKDAEEMEDTKYQNTEYSAGINVTELRESKTTSVVRQSSFQDLEDPFDIDLQACSQEIERNLDSRRGEDLWLNGCWATA